MRIQEGIDRMWGDVRRKTYVILGTKLYAYSERY